MVFRIVNDIFVQKDINVCGDTNIGGVGTQTLAEWGHKYWLTRTLVNTIIGDTNIGWRKKKSY